MAEEEHKYLDCLDERKRYLNLRIRAKQAVKWETIHDIAERDALSWALERLREKE